MQGLDIAIESGGGTTLVRLLGDAGISNADHLQHKLTLLAALDPPRVVFDLSGLTFISSLGMGELVKFSSSAKRKGHTVVFAGIDGDVREAFTRARLDDVLFIVDDVEAALAG